MLCCVPGLWIRRDHVSCLSGVHDYTKTGYICVDLNAILIFHLEQGADHTFRIAGDTPGSQFRTDTPVDAIGDAEKFVLIDIGDMLVWIRTFAGSYISLGSAVTAGLSNISRALKFRLQLFNLAPGPTG